MAVNSTNHLPTIENVHYVHADELKNYRYIAKGNVQKVSIHKVYKMPFKCKGHFFTTFYCLSV